MSEIGLLKNYEALGEILRTIVYAKQMGMMDHREARDLYIKCLGEAGVKLPEPGQRPIRGGSQG